MVLLQIVCNIPLNLLQEHYFIDFVLLQSGAYREWFQPFLLLQVLQCTILCDALLCCP